MRKKILISSLALLFLSAIMAIAGKFLFASEGVIKIGHIRSLTGPVAITNDKMVKGFNLALEQANYEVAGKKIEVILEDDGAKADVSIDKARKLVEKDKVDIIVGPTLGGLQMGVSTFLNRVGIPNVHSNPSPYGIIASKHKWTIQVGGASPQISSCGGRYAYEKLGIRKAVVICEDSASGHTYIESFVAGFKKAGGAVIQEQWTPLGCSDYAPYFAAAKPADACIAWASGNDSVKFLNQYYEFGMWGKMRLLPAYQAGLIESFIIARLTPKAAIALEGLVCAIQYTPLLDNKANKNFVEAYQKKYHQQPDSAESTAYCAALVILDALKNTKGDTAPQKFMDAMLSSTIMTTEGPVRFDKQKKSAIKDIPISKLEKANGTLLFSKPIFIYKNVPPEGL